MAKKKITVDIKETQTTATHNPKVENGEVLLEPELTQKQIFENLHAEMTKYGIHSIGQLEVKISQQK